MDPEAEKKFVEFRRALKICSVVLVIVAMVRIPFVLNSISQTQALWDDLMANPESPWVFGLANFLQSSFLLFLLANIVILTICILITRKSQGGGFLYLNVGIFVAFSIFNGVLISETQELMKAPLEEMIGPL